MNLKISTCTLSMLIVSAASAQVASHAPTVFKPTASAASASTSEMLALNPSGKPVARVNGSVLTDADLVREENAIFPYARQHNGLPKDLAPQIREGAMKMLIFEELVYQEALRRKLTVPAAKMQQAELDFRKQFETPDEFNALMQSEFHGSEPLLREKIRRSLLIESFLKSEVESKSSVSLAEARAYYEKNPSRYERAESYTFQTISVLPPPKATPDQVKEGRPRADKALLQAKATKTAEDFGLLAEKISDDDFRVMMGQHKPVPASELAPSVLRALQNMKPGDVSDVIQVEQAYTIVRLNEHAHAGKAKFEEVKAQLEKELTLSKSNQLRAALDKKLRENAKIEEL